MTLRAFPVLVAVPALAVGGFGARMSDIAAQWRNLAALLKDQSEREHCAPQLFSRAGEAMAQLADAEEAFFRDLAHLAANEPSAVSTAL